MSKRGKGSKRYQAAPWSDDFNALKKGGVSPWFRKKEPSRGFKGGGKVPRGGGRS